MARLPIFEGMKPGKQLFVFILLAFSFFVLIYLIGLGFGYLIWGKEILTAIQGINLNDTASNTVDILKYLQIISQIGLFIIPTFLFAFLVHKNTADYLSISVAPSIHILLLSGMLIVLGMPFLGWIIELNESMKLPSFMAGFEGWMKKTQDANDDISELFLNTGSLNGLAVNLLMMAILPALGEELLFRGVIQRIFTDWFGKKHLPVIITSIIFSAFHFQFYGFFPRFLLGLFLGYSLLWSRSIWVPVFVHFLNNGIAVVVAFLSTKGLIATNYEDFGKIENPWLITISFVLVVAGCFMIYKYAQKKEKVKDY